MTSGAGVPEQRTGEFRDVGRDGGTGVPVVSSRQGSARPLIAVASLLLTVLCLVLVVVRMQADGVLILATVFAGVHVWAIGAHRKSFWR